MAFLLDHWLALTCLLAAAALGMAALVQWYRHAAWRWLCYLPATVLASFGVGAFGFLQPWWLGPALAATAFAAFVGMLALVILNGFWSAPAAYAFVALFFVGLGDLTGASVAEGLRIAGLFLISLRPQEPWWLLLWLLVPVLVWTSWANLVTLGPARRWMVMCLRCSLIVFLALALSEAFARKPNDSVTVIFLWDRSLSMPPEFERGQDQREQRIFEFINDSVSHNSSRKRDDRVGVIVFGKDARLELPPHSVDKLKFKKIYSPIDNSYTDIAAAVKLALASFPEGAGKRIVLISDGSENLGQAEEQARIAKQNGVQIDVVPIAAGRKHQNEILIERIEAPSVTEKGAAVPLRVVIRSFHPQIVEARLQLRKITFNGKNQERDPDPTPIKLRQGLQAFQFPQVGAKDDNAVAYEATVIPIAVRTKDGALVHRDLPGDRVDNNQARVTVMSRGQRAVLLLESEPGKHQLLVNRLRALESGLKIVTLTINSDREDPNKNVNELHQLTKGDNERLATLLTKFDAIILANLPAEALTEDEQKVIRSQVHDQGSGLIMIGGNQSFGAGGWQNTEIEKALPVNMDLKSMKVEGKSGLVLIMHASEIAEGNAWQRKIAKLALEKLSPMDWVGQIHYDHGFNGGRPGHRWHIPFQEVAGHRQRLLRLVDSMQPGDMPDVDPAFQLAHKELTNKELQLGTKHIILISDGDHWDASRQMINKLNVAKITCTTVCITSHGAAEVQKMAAVAKATGGRGYHVKDPKELPAIYIKETRLVSQSFIHEDKKGFAAKLIYRDGPTAGMEGNPPPLYGFVRTTPKESSLVKTLIETDKIGGYKFPILAAWQYGLGRSVAFTSDARTIPQGAAYWDKDWANSDLYAKFWDQTVRWILRPTESGKFLFLSTEQRDGKIRLIVEAHDEDKTPITDLELKAGITSPAFKVRDDKKTELKFEQRNAGVYEAEIPADEVGAYFVNIHAKWKKVTIGPDGKKKVEEMSDNVRTGVTIPYSPEFAEMDANVGLLEKMREMTAGQRYPDDAEALAKVANNAEVFRPTSLAHGSLQAIWPWLVFLTALCLLLDVAVRRIAIQPEIVWAKAVVQWQRLRGQASAEDRLPEYIERLKSRKASVSEALDKEKAAKKFEAAAGAVTAEAPTVTPVTPMEKPKPAPMKPKQDEEADFATRLMRAKKKAMEDRDKDKK